MKRESFIDWWRRLCLIIREKKDKIAIYPEEQAINGINRIGINADEFVPQKAIKFLKGIIKL